MATSEWVPVLSLLRSEVLPVQDLVHPSLGFLREKTGRAGALQMRMTVRHWPPHSWLFASPRVVSEGWWLSESLGHTWQFSVA